MCVLIFRIGEVLGVKGREIGFDGIVFWRIGEQVSVPRFEKGGVGPRPEFLIEGVYPVASGSPFEVFRVKSSFVLLQFLRFVAQFLT